MFPDPSFDPLELHRAAIVVDGHADTPQRFTDEAWNFSDDIGSGHINLAAARQGGLTASFFALWPEPTAWRGQFAQRTRQLLDATLDQIAHHPADLMLGLAAADIRTAKQTGRFCILLGIEGGHAIENSLDKLREFHALGVRYMTLTWNNSNEWADSSGDLDDATVAHHGGLTDFGRGVVREMNRLGMMVDLSHVSDATFHDALGTSRAPVIASHSCARALCGAGRNLADDQLRALATADGLCMVNFYPSFLDETWRAAWNATAAERFGRLRASLNSDRHPNYAEDLANDRAFFLEQFSRSQARVPFEALLDHIEYIARVAGPDHVGLGSDFDGFSILPAGLDSAADLPSITEGLARRGWSAVNLRKLLGENLLRVLDRVQALAG